MSVNELLKKLGQHFKSKVKTTVFIEDKKIKLVYHNTMVVDFDTTNGVVGLRTGGWYTRTTQRRINDFLEIIEYDTRIINKNGMWFVTGKHNFKVDYHDDFYFVETENYEKLMENGVSSPTPA